MKTADELLKEQNPDANLWAQAFMAQHNGPRVDVIDEDTMRAWFASAMMAMHDHVHNNDCRKYRQAIYDLFLEMKQSMQYRVNVVEEVSGLKVEDLMKMNREWL